MENNLRKIREEKGLTLREVAEKADTSIQQVQRLEKGERELTIKWLNIFKNVYDISVKDICPELAKQLGAAQDHTGLAEPPQAKTDFTVPDYARPRPAMDSAAPVNDTPVYGYASGANSRIALNDGAVIEYRPRHPKMGHDGFYLIVHGDSMEPRYEQGEVIAVSRALPARKGHDCVIEFLDGTALIKRLLARTDTEITCRQFNPDKELTYNTKDIKALYAVVGRE